MTDKPSVWIVMTHEGWGEDTMVAGVFATQSAAEDYLRREGMTLDAADRDTWSKVTHVANGIEHRRYADIEEYEIRGR